MKKNCVIFILAGLTLSSCYERTYSTTSEGLMEVLVDEKWIVKFFSVNDLDRTREFVDYQFIFANNQVISCYNPVNNHLQSGNYSVTGTDSTVFLTINMGVDAEYADFNYVWQVMEITTKTIRTERGAGGNGQMSYLTFQKP